MSDDNIRKLPLSNEARFKALIGAHPPRGAIPALAVLLKQGLVHHRAITAHFMPEQLHWAIRQGLLVVRETYYWGLTEEARALLEECAAEGIVDT